MARYFPRRLLAGALAFASVGLPLGVGNAAPHPVGSQGLLDAQIEAWNRGDLEGALQSYCNSPDITWVNRSGISRGYNDFAHSMRTQFSDASEMGQLAIDLLHDQPLDHGGRLLVIRWSINRQGARLMGGVSTQLWAECGGRTSVVFEHAS